MFLGSGADSGAVSYIKNLVFFLSMLYPLFYGLAVIVGRAALNGGASWGKVLLLGCIPIMSGFPLLQLWGLYMEFSL